MPARITPAHAKKLGIDAQLPPRDSISVTLSLPPSTNNLFASVKGIGKPRRARTKAYQTWRKLAAHELSFVRFHVPSPVEVYLYLAGNVNQQRDADNFWKPVLDALVNAGIIDGDSLKHVQRLQLTYNPIPNLEAHLQVVVAHLETA